jgi:flagellar protein FlbD
MTRSKGSLGPLVQVLFQAWARLLIASVTGKLNFNADREWGAAMILLTKLNDRKFVLNAELIEIIEETPDTVITLTSGKKLVVKETIDVCVEKVIDYRKRIFNKF